MTSPTLMRYSAHWGCRGNLCFTECQMISMGTQNCRAYVKNMAIAMTTFTDCPNLKHITKNTFYLHCIKLRKNKISLYFELKHFSFHMNKITNSLETAFVIFQYHSHIFGCMCTDTKEDVPSIKFTIALTKKKQDKCFSNLWLKHFSFLSEPLKKVSQENVLLNDKIDHSTQWQSFLKAENPIILAFSILHL